MLKNKVLFILFSTLIFSCSDNDLKTGWWKYGGGQYIGGILTFDDSNISNDTIYKNDTAIGIIVDREKSFFGITSRKIFIKPLIKSVDIYEENFNFIKANLPNSKENYINPYPKGLGVYHKKYLYTMESKDIGKFKAIESFGIKRRNEFYIIGELIEGAIKKDWFVLIPFNNTLSMTVRIKEIEEVIISGEDKKYTLLITTTELEDSFDFMLGMKIGNEDLLISEIGED